MATKTQPRSDRMNAQTGATTEQAKSERSGFVPPWGWPLHAACRELIGARPPKAGELLAPEKARVAEARALLAALGPATAQTPGAN